MAKMYYDQDADLNLLKGKKVADILDKQNINNICKQIGKQVAQMHNKNIIHGDLTTSNFIVKKDTKTKQQVYFIDFGLSFNSNKVGVIFFCKTPNSLKYRISFAFSMAFLAVSE